MRSSRRFSRILGPAGMFVLSAAASLGPGGAAHGAEPPDPMAVRLRLIGEPTVKWLPPAVRSPNAEARTEAEMKPYTETLSSDPQKVAFDMVPIRGGKFLMGSPAGEKGRKQDEGPQHEVTIEPFWMGRCEVTWDEFDLWAFSLERIRRGLRKVEPTDRDRLCDALAETTKPYCDLTFGMGKQGHPAVCMTQFTAKLHCKWLSATTGRYYRLPTEAEWEYACRAGTTTAYSFGDDPACFEDYAWYFGNSEDKYHKVGLKNPNPWGLYDMHGNVAEWVLDQHLADFYGRSPARSPLAEPRKLYPRVVRGGSWDDDPEALRSAARQGSSGEWSQQDPQEPKDIYFHTYSGFVGFRVVRPLRVPAAEECKRYEMTADDVKRLDENLASRRGIGADEPGD